MAMASNREREWECQHHVLCAGRERSRWVFCNLTIFWALEFSWFFFVFRSTNIYFFSVIKGNQHVAVVQRVTLAICATMRSPLGSVLLIYWSMLSLLALLTLVAPVLGPLVIRFMAPTQTLPPVLIYHRLFRTRSRAWRIRSSSWRRPSQSLSYPDQLPLCSTTPTMVKFLLVQSNFRSLNLNNHYRSPSLNRHPNPNNLHHYQTIINTLVNQHHHRSSIHNHLCNRLSSLQLVLWPMFLLFPKDQNMMII